MSRLLSSLHKLLRVKQHHIEQLRQRVALLNGQIEVRLQAIEKNISYINTERLIASVNIQGSDTLEAFVEQKILQNKKYEQENSELQKIVNEIQAQLYEVYIEQKQFEKVKSQEQNRVDIEKQRKENQVIDEMANQVHLSNLTKF